MVGHVSMEVAKTVLEVADVAWTAVECCHNHHHHQQHDGEHHDPTSSYQSPNHEKVDDVENFGSLRSENQRLRNLLEQNLNLLQNISQSPSLLQNCPLDLHARLVSAVNSRSFLNQLESHRSGTDSSFPFREASGTDIDMAEILIEVDHKEPSWWVWVTDEMFPSNSEEQSGLDDENYLIVSEEHVVDAVANFMAKCILSNLKAKELTPKDLQKAMTNALGGMNKVEKMLNIWHAWKMFYTLSSWGLALVGLYKTRAVLRLAALGVHTTSKVVLKAL